MTRCIYCTNTLLARGTPGNQREWMSLEHIIPLAIGGSDDLATEDACEGCNNDLGADVDSAMLRDPFVVIYRQRFRLAGHSGKIPNLEMKGRSRQTGSEVSVSIGPDLNVRWRSPIDVARELRPDGKERISVQGTPEETLRIVSGIKKSAEAKGLRMFEADGRPIDNLEQSVAAAMANAQYDIELEVNTSHEVAAVARGLSKVAFGFAHLALGPDWTFSACADNLRRAARGLSSDEEIIQLVVSRPVEMRDALLSSEESRETRHLIAIVPMEENSVIYVSLFGAPLLSLVFPIPISATQIKRALTEGRPFMVSSLATGKDVQWELPHEITARLAKELARFTE
jgi:hypothetical protein